MSATAGAIDALLPQHQCRRCGYQGCRPYAEAVAQGEAEINRCPPGGVLVVEDLARLLGREPLPLDPETGGIEAEAIARVDPEACIGCTKCLPACPVDAIVGAPKRLHEVIPAACTGCGLCVEPCPVDCIRLTPDESVDHAYQRLAPAAALAPKARQRLRTRADDLRLRYARHGARVASARRRRRRDLDAADGDLAARRAEISAAVKRVRARRHRQ